MRGCSVKPNLNNLQNGEQTSSLSSNEWNKDTTLAIYTLLAFCDTAPVIQGLWNAVTVQCLNTQTTFGLRKASPLIKAAILLKLIIERPVYIVAYKMWSKHQGVSATQVLFLWGFSVICCPSFRRVCKGHWSTRHAHSVTFNPATAKPPVIWNL